MSRLAAAFAAGAALGRARSASSTDLPIPTWDELRHALAQSAMDRAARNRRPSQGLQTPQMPVLLDGKKVEPREILRLPPSRLQYVVSQDTYDEGNLHVFVRPEAAEEYMDDVRERFKIPRLGGRGAATPTEQTGDEGSGVGGSKR